MYKKVDDPTQSTDTAHAHNARVETLWWGKATQTYEMSK